MSSTKIVERKGQKTFEIPKTIFIGPAKGMSFLEKVTITRNERFSVLFESPNVRHGPFSSTKETQIISSVWSFSEKRLVEKKTVFRRDIEKNYVNGKVEGEVVQKNWLYSLRSKEMRLSSTVSSRYENGVEIGTRVMKDASGKVIEPWKNSWA
ncbi:hypothetical protein [Brazilian marseillevirus]|uniref:hypothetical protein n=1 Tax=Brazilian marseillevirus TaxID=1813599 RepID=UPI000780508B|nr:hypothetical protein A3303_gp147 [Brazilian marseillevirus]AMQ10655.1 hypothetical protein [Brazilian marseillevirus]